MAEMKRGERQKVKGFKNSSLLTKKIKKYTQ
jgi:hypothetical protein